MDRHLSSFKQGLLLGAAAAAGVALARYLHTPARRRPSFAGQVVVITGGSRGLGLAMAHQFAHEGATLVLLARSADQLARAAEDLESFGARVETIECDIRNQTAVVSAIDRVIRVYGRVDVLVNNAGVVQVTPFVHAQVHDFEDSLNTHFWGPLFLIRACLPHFRRQGAGHIVNVSSVGGRVAVPHLTPYCVGKFALAGLSDALHAELAPLGISVTTVTPFLMRTGGHRNAVVRGQHRKEALWFALGSASALTAFSADGAARTIVEAVRQRRARVAPGWPSRASEVVQTIVPELTAALGAAVVRWMLPGPSTAFDANIGRKSRDLDLGGAARLLATNAARRWNQQLAADERQRHAR